MDRKAERPTERVRRSQLVRLAGHVTGEGSNPAAAGSLFSASRSKWPSFYTSNHAHKLALLRRQLFERWMP